MHTQLQPAACVRVCLCVVSCKKRTTSFCYVHKASVCDDCTASKCAGTLAASSAVPCAPNDVLGNYFDWCGETQLCDSSAASESSEGLGSHSPLLCSLLCFRLADGDFSSPICSLCNRSIGPEASSLVRLVCKDLFHRECLRESLARSLAGPPALSPAQLKCPSCNLALVDPNTQPRTKLREAVADFVAQVARGGGAAAVSSSTGGPSTPSRSATGRREDEDRRAASPAASSAVGGAGDSRFSPQVRDLMSKAASARAALPAGAILPADALAASPASSTSAGLYPPAAATAASSVRVASPLSSSSSPAATAASSSVPSALAASAAAAAQAKADLEAQLESDDLKGHKPSRLASVRRALSRSKFIVMIVVTLALLMLLFAYGRSTRAATPADTKLAASILSPEN